MEHDAPGSSNEANGGARIWANGASSESESLISLKIFLNIVFRKNTGIIYSKICKYKNNKHVNLYNENQKHAITINKIITHFHS